MSLNTKTPTTNTSTQLWATAINDLDAWSCFILMLLKHFPSLLRGNFLANQKGPDEFALWFQLWAIFLVSSCPLRPDRRLGACSPFIRASVLLCRWKSSGTWHPWQRAVDSRGITLLHWQRDINGEITNLWDACPMRLTHRDVRPASDVGVGLCRAALTSITRQNEWIRKEAIFMADQQSSWGDNVWLWLFKDPWHGRKWKGKKGREQETNSFCWCINIRFDAYVCPSLVTRARPLFHSCLTRPSNTRA